MNLVITTNGPGEVYTWVRPFIKYIRDSQAAEVWIFLTPCMFAGGNEKRVLGELEGISCIFTAGKTLRYAVAGFKPAGMPSGVIDAVLCLGGDWTYAGILAKRFKCPCYIYCERIGGKIKKAAVYFTASASLAGKLAGQGADANKVICAGSFVEEAVKPEEEREAVRESVGINDSRLLINIFPGSRYRWLEYSIPFFIKVVECLPDSLAVVFTISPFISKKELKNALDICFKGDWNIAGENDKYFNIRIGGTFFTFFTGNQYDAMSASDLAVALPGSSNIELAVLGVPTFVVLPLNYPERIPVPGVFEYLCRLPIVGKLIKRKLVIPGILNRLAFVSPVNREAGREIFPEMTGILKPQKVAAAITEICRSGIREIKAGIPGRFSRGDAVTEQGCKKKASQVIFDKIKADISVPE